MSDEIRAAVARIQLFLDARESMTGLDQEEITSVGSAASGHKLVTLLTSDLRTLLSGPTDEEVNESMFALARSAFPGGFQGAELSFEDWWNRALPESAREGYRQQARIALAAAHQHRTGGTR